VDTLFGESPDGHYTACHIDQFKSEYYIIVTESVVKDDFGEGHLPKDKPSWNMAVLDFMKILHIEDVPAPKWRLLTEYN